MSVTTMATATATAMAMAMATATATATAFAWHVLGAQSYPPPAPKRGQRSAPTPTGVDVRCWLCGGPTGGVGWPRSQAIPPTFTNANLAADPSSTTVCQPCAALGGSETWKRECERRPEKGWKWVQPLSWRSYSHAFIWPDRHECPTRAEWREWLIEPPAPPFLFVVTLSGQKHLIFRARIAYSRDTYPVQMEEFSLMVNRAEFRRCLDDFEALYRLGFSKDSILSGSYHHAQLLKVGLAMWRPRERRMQLWRQREPGLLTLVHFCARRLDPEPEPEGEEVSR